MGKKKASGRLVAAKEAATKKADALAAKQQAPPAVVKTKDVKPTLVSGEEPSSSFSYHSAPRTVVRVCTHPDMENFFFFLV